MNGLRRSSEGLHGCGNERGTSVLVCLGSFDQIARAVIASEKFDCFDRIIVQQARRAPIIIEASGP
jgi:hypothetical protein